MGEEPGREGTVVREYRGNYFGERWDAPAFDEAVEVPTPVGATCPWCTEEIAEGDRGQLMPQVRTDAKGQLYSNAGAVHLECMMRSVLGSPSHMRKLCSCFGGEGDHDDERPWREQGRIVMEIIELEKGFA